MSNLYAIFNSSETNDKILNSAINYKNNNLRGNDWFGYSIFNNNYSNILSENRLVILDPYYTAFPLIQDNIYLLFDGIIYNYLEIEEFLIKKLNNENLNNEKLNNEKLYKTRLTCECIIHLYKKYKENFINYIDGIFSFILYDKKKDKFIIGRDPLGIKPLFYSIKQKNDKLNPELKFSSIKTNDINKIFPSGNLFIKNVGFIRYFKHTWDITKTINITNKNMIKIIYNVISKRLMSVVQFGVFLDGSVYSALIASIILKIYKEYKENNIKINTKLLSFSIENQKELVKFLGTTHYQWSIKNVSYYEKINALGKYLNTLGIKMLLLGFGGEILFSNKTKREKIILLKNYHKEKLQYIESIFAKWNIETRYPYLDLELINAMLYIEENVYKGNYFNELFDVIIEPYLPKYLLKK